MSGSVRKIFRLRNLTLRHTTTPASHSHTHTFSLWTDNCCKNAEGPAPSSIELVTPVVAPSAVVFNFRPLLRMRNVLLVVLVASCLAAIAATEPPAAQWWIEVISTPKEFRSQNYTGAVSEYLGIKADAKVVYTYVCAEPEAAAAKDVLNTDVCAKKHTGDASMAFVLRLTYPKDAKGLPPINDAQLKLPGALNNTNFTAKTRSLVIQVEDGPVAKLPAQATEPPAVHSAVVILMELACVAVSLLVSGIIWKKQSALPKLDEDSPIGSPLVKRSASRTESHATEGDTRTASVNNTTAGEQLGESMMEGSQNQLQSEGTIS